MTDDRPCAGIPGTKSINPSVRTLDVTNFWPGFEPWDPFPLTAQMTTPEDQRAFVFNSMLS